PSDHTSFPTRRSSDLNDHQLCVLTRDEWKILNNGRSTVVAEIQQLDWDPGDADKGSFPHHMLKEIYEQPEVIERAMAGRLDEARSEEHTAELQSRGQP